MRTPYFDAHCDTIVAAYFEGKRLRVNALHLDLERLSWYAPCAQIFAFCAPEEKDMHAAYHAAKALMLKELTENSDIISLCRSAAEARAAASDGKIAAFLSVEGAEHLRCSEDDLRRAYGEGVRIVNITWNFDNALSGAAFGEAGGGLTERGRSFLALMQELGMLADMSHISEPAFWDAAQMTARPLIASHSNSKALCDNPRNLTDAQFKALAKTGGGAGLNLCPDFLGLTRDIGAVLEHAEHFLALGGASSLFLGGDLDGIDDTPAGISGVQDMDRLYEAMLRRNWSEELVRDIFYNNLMGIMERAL